jgi:hypothetical protein
VLLSCVPCTCFGEVSSLDLWVCGCGFVGFLNEFGEMQWLLAGLGNPYRWFDLDSEVG